MAVFLLVLSLSRRDNVQFMSASPLLTLLFHTLSMDGGRDGEKEEVSWFIQALLVWWVGTWIKGEDYQVGDRWIIAFGGLDDEAQMYVGQMIHG